MKKEKGRFVAERVKGWRKMLFCGEMWVCRLGKMDVQVGENRCAKADSVRVPIR